jgi:endonuclease/exonuclease/phosphatase family metal-dependent hydrolase
MGSAAWYAPASRRAADTSSVQLRVLTWNLFHGRDFPPDPSLRTWRSRLLRIEERNDTHLQVNRDLLPEFSEVLCRAAWDVALLQECPPRWTRALARSCGAVAHVSLTSRNSLGGLRALLARQNPDLIASNEGGSNMILHRSGAFEDSRVLALRDGPHPERRTMGLARLAGGICVANLHASTADELAAQELLLAARAALEWAGEAPLILGGDFNVRPDHSPVFDELAELSFSRPSEPSAIDHILARRLEVVEPAHRWSPEAREVREDGLAIRLSDHAPVEALFATGEAAP